MDKQNTEHSEGIETILSDTVTIGTCQYTFVRTHRMYNTKSEAWYKLWTWGDRDISV